jgi:hypothetical protein
MTAYHRLTPYESPLFSPYYFLFTVQKFALYYKYHTLEVHVTHKNVSPPFRKFLPFIIILIIIPLLGCNLTNLLGGQDKSSDAMTLEEALEITPVDGRPIVMEEMGPPDAFTINFRELEGQMVRWETWSYFDYTTMFEFVDGELIWTIELEEVPNGSIFAHWYDPFQFQAGLSPADIGFLLADQELLEVDLTDLDLEGSLALAGDQILLGFVDDQLVYVETVILSPAEDGQPLGDDEPVSSEGDEPADTAPIQFVDDFESETSLAKPIFNSSFMEYENIDGKGVLTTHYKLAVMGAYYDEPILEDFILEVEIHPLGSAEGAKAGVMFRSQNSTIESEYYYTISVMPSEQQIRFEAWFGGEFAVWEHQDIPENLVPKYGIYNLKVDCQTDSIQVYLSDELAAEFTSDLIQGPGNFGLMTVSSEIPETVLFDNLVITEHP